MYFVAVEEDYSMEQLGYFNRASLGDAPADIRLSQ